MPARKPSPATGRDHPLAVARRAAGLSQAQLAEKAGISRNTVARLETVGHTPSVAIAIALARALGESVEVLFGGGE